MKTRQSPRVDDRSLPTHGPPHARSRQWIAGAAVQPAAAESPQSEEGSLRSPEQTARAFAAALSKGDLGAATACFARDGCFLTPDATAIRGREDIRMILAQMLAGCTWVRIDVRGMLTVGETALGSECWTLGSNGADGAPFERASTSLTVLRLIEDEWKLAIVAPWSESTPAF